MKKQTRTQLLQNQLDRAKLQEFFLVEFRGDGFYISNCYDSVFLGRDYQRSRTALNRFIRNKLYQQQKAEEKRQAIARKSMEMRRDNRMCRDDKCLMAVHCWRHTYSGRKPDRYQKYGDYNRGDREQCDYFVESWTG